MVHVSEKERPRRSPASDRVEIRIYNGSIEAQGWPAILTFILIACALLFGIAFAFILGAKSLTGTDWNIVFIAMGTLCLGFGSASALYQHTRSKQNSALKAQYESLRTRADALLEEFNAYEKNKSNALARGN